MRNSNARTHCTHQLETHLSRPTIFSFLAAKYFGSLEIEESRPHAVLHLPKKETQHDYSN